MEARDGVLKTIEYRVRRPGRVELFETVPPDLLDKQWRRVLPRSDTSQCELVGISDFLEAQIELVNRTQGTGFCYRSTVSKNISRVEGRQRRRVNQQFGQTRYRCWLRQLEILIRSTSRDDIYLNDPRISRADERWLYCSIFFASHKLTKTSL